MEKKHFFKFMLLAFIICMPFALISCSDDDDEETNVVYTMGFDKLNSSDLSSLEETAFIEKTFKQSLGVNASPFTLHGTVGSCDSQVISACQKAEKQLGNRVFKSHFTFVVRNVNTNKEVYKFIN